MNKITAVFFDVDGTLLNSEHKMLESTKEVLRKLEEKGIPYAIASARGPASILPLFEQFDFRAPMVSFNGALVYDINENVIKSTGMEKEEAAEVIDFVENHSPDVLLNYYSYFNWMVKDAEHPRIIAEEGIAGEKAISLTVRESDFDEFHQIYCLGSPEDIDELEKALVAKYPDLYIAKSSPVDVLINRKGISKARGMEILAENQGWDTSSTVAFGDGFNDKEMLEHAKYSFAMGNAPEDLKQYAKTVTDTNDNDGIYKAMKSLGLFD